MTHKTATALRHAISFQLILGIFSCVNNIDDTDDNPGTDKQYPVVLTTQIQQSATRISSSGFDTGDEIGLFMLNQDNTLSDTRHANNVKFTFTEEKGFTSTKKLYYNSENIPTDFISYYPYKTNAVVNGSSTINFAVQKDQSQWENYSKSDFLVASKKDVSPSSDPVDLLFKHKMCRIDLRIKPNEKYDLNQIKALNPIIKLKGINTSATYDFENNTFSDQKTIGDIVPYGNWEIKDGHLTGKTLLAIPQTVEQGHKFIELTMDGRTFEYNLSKPAELDSGEPNEMTIVMQSKNEVESIITARIEDWGEIINQEEINASEVYSYININDINFAESSVFKVLHNDEQIAEITREYLLSNNINAQAIVIYPVRNGKTNLQEGMVLNVIGENANIHGGTINWDTTNNTFNYIQGTSSPIDKIYFSEDKDILDSPQGKIISTQLIADILVDKRGDETITYPLVKIGTQYWMRSNLKTTKYTNGDNILKGTSITNSTAMYCAIQNTYFFYSSVTISSGKMNADGWRISNKKDWDNLKNYINNNTSVLKNGTSWNQSSGIEINNLTGFNAVATGFYKTNYQSNNEHLFYWVTKDNDPISLENPVVISYNSNALNTGTLNNDLGLCIRCLRND